jgi:hypothetical protein
VNHLLIDRGPPIRRCLLGAVVFLVPTAFAYPFTNDPYNTPKLGVLIVGTSAAAALRLYEALWGRPLASLRPLLLPGVAMAAPLMLAWPASPYRDFATLGEYSRWQGLVPTLVLIGFSLLVAEARGSAADPRLASRLFRRGRGGVRLSFRCSDSTP